MIQPDSNATAGQSPVDRPVRPHVTSVRVTYGEPRKTPKVGDRRTTKAHGVQIRVQRMARDWQGKPIGRIVSGGRPCFDWRTPCELDPWDHYLLTAEERSALTGRPGGLTAQQRS